MKAHSKAGALDEILSTQQSDLFLSRCLLLDLETTQQARILKIGAVLGDKQFLRTGQFDLPESMLELDRFAAHSECIIGHNLLQHDLVRACPISMRFENSTVKGAWGERIIPIASELYLNWHQERQ